MNGGGRAPEVRQVHAGKGHGEVFIDAQPGSRGEEEELFPLSLPHLLLGFLFWLRLQPAQGWESGKGLVAY